MWCGTRVVTLREQRLSLIDLWKINLLVENQFLELAPLTRTSTHLTNISDSMPDVISIF